MSNHTDRITPTMGQILISMLNRESYPAVHNNSRIFQALEAQGLIQCDFYDNWALTDQGRRTAIQLLRK